MSTITIIAFPTAPAGKEHELAAQFDKLHQRPVPNPVASHLPSISTYRLLTGSRYTRNFAIRLRSMPICNVCIQGSSWNGSRPAVRYFILNSGTKSLPVKRSAQPHGCVLQVNSGLRLWSISAKNEAKYLLALEARHSPFTEAIKSLSNVSGREADVS